MSNMKKQNFRYPHLKLFIETPRADPQNPLDPKEDVCVSLEYLLLLHLDRKRMNIHFAI